LLQKMVVVTLTSPLTLRLLCRSWRQGRQLH
jgi:hypothetical protein